MLETQRAALDTLLSQEARDRWLLRTRVGRPISRFRTTAAWVRQAAAQRATPLQTADRAALGRLRGRLTASFCAEDFDVRDAVALIDTLLALGVKIEPERY